MISFSFWFDFVSKVRKMKTWLGLLVFFFAVSEISAVKVTVSIFYETLCSDCMALFKNQIWPVYKNDTIRKNVHIELVPYGKASYKENPFEITCQHGPPECYGNVMNACFMARNPDNYKQVAFVSCCMSERDPPSAGQRCAKKLGYSYKGVEECTKSEEGNNLQIKHGKRTGDFEYTSKFIPTIVYDNKFDQKDQDDSLSNFRGVIARKLQKKGIYID